MVVFYWIVGILGVIAAFQLLVAPIIVRFAIKIPLHPDIDPIEAESLDRDVATYFMQARADLAPLGFESVGYFAIHGYTPNQKWFLQTFVNMQTHELASANVVRQPAKQIELNQQAISFVSRFTNGKSCGTTNVGSASPFPRDGTRVRDAVGPGLPDVNTLLAAHRASCADFVLDPKAAIKAPDTPEAGLRRSLEEQMRDRVQSGHLYIDDELSMYRPTWFGAFTMTWRLVWPIKSIRAAFARKWAIRMSLRQAPFFATATEAAIEDVPTR